MPRKPKPGTARFKFVGGDEKWLYWESVSPMLGDSRHIQYKVPRAWFWKGLSVTKP